MENNLGLNQYLPIGILKKEYTNKMIIITIDKLMNVNDLFIYLYSYLFNSNLIIERIFLIDNTNEIIKYYNISIINNYNYIDFKL
jgi:hypothetical protein